MKKLLSKLAIVLCAAMTLLAVGLFTACGGSKDVTYSITLETPDGSAFNSETANIMIGFCEGVDGACRMFQVDEEGKCTISSSELSEEYTGDYVVKLLRKNVSAESPYKTYDESHKTYDISKKQNGIVIVLELKDAE